MPGVAQASSLWMGKTGKMRVLLLTAVNNPGLAGLRQESIAKTARDSLLYGITPQPPLGRRNGPRVVKPSNATAGEAFAADGLPPMGAPSRR